MNATTKGAGHRGRYAADPMLDEPKYLLGDAAAAAGISVGLLKSWVSREPRVIVLGPYDREAHGKGSARVFTLRRLISIAATAELVSLGLAPSWAAIVAYALTDCEFQKTGKRKASKGPADLFLIAYPDEKFFRLTSAKVSIDDLLERSAPPGPATSCVVLSYPAIRDRVRERLAERAGTK